MPLAPAAGASVPALAAVRRADGRRARALGAEPQLRRPRAIGIAALVLVAILLIVRYARGFVANISVLLGIVVGAASPPRSA